MTLIVDSVIKSVQDEINKENKVPKGWRVFRTDKDGKPRGLYAPKASYIDYIEYVEFKEPVHGVLSYWNVLDVAGRLTKLSGHLTAREACILAVRCAINDYMTHLRNEEDVMRSMLED